MTNNTGNSGNFANLCKLCYRINREGQYRVRISYQNLDIDSDWIEVIVRFYNINKKSFHFRADDKSKTLSVIRELEDLLRTDK